MNLGALSVVGWIFVIFVTVFVPWVVLRNREGAIAMGSVPLGDRFMAMLMPQVFLGVLAASTGWLEGIELFPARLPSLAAWCAGTAFLLVTLVLVRPHWRRSVAEQKPTWRLFAPTTPRERRMWVCLSLAAGIAEELVWRGVLPALLLDLVGNQSVAIIVSVISFALAHAIQGMRSVLAIATIAASFHGLVLISGSLYVPMTVHFIYDVIAGFTYAGFARELGFLDAPSDQNDSRTD